MPRRSSALRPPCLGTRLAFNRHNPAHSSGFLLASLSKMPRPGFAPAPHVSAPGHFRSRLTTTLPSIKLMEEWGVIYGEQRAVRRNGITSWVNEKTKGNALAGVDSVASTRSEFDAVGITGLGFSCRVFACECERFARVRQVRT